MKPPFDLFSTSDGMLILAVIPFVSVMAAHFDHYFIKNKGRNS